MKITWNEGKRAQNLKKHGVDFDIAQYVFDDPHYLSEQARIEHHEYRWYTVGMVGGILLTVGHSYEDHGEEEIIRIITARRASSKERKQYHETQASH